jgi:hypothetical protein
MNQSAAESLHFASSGPVADQQRKTQLKPKTIAS